ncbi:hypothetical protein ACWGH8_11750 [Nonomuraea muscovyensis]
MYPPAGPPEPDASGAGAGLPGAAVSGFGRRPGARQAGGGHAGVCGHGLTIDGEAVGVGVPVGVPGADGPGDTVADGPGDTVADGLGDGVADPGSVGVAAGLDADGLGETPGPALGEALPPGGGLVVGVGSSVDT